MKNICKKETDKFFKLYGLAERELRLANLIVNNNSVGEILSLMGCSNSYMYFEFSKICEKLKMKNNSMAMAMVLFFQFKISKLRICEISKSDTGFKINHNLSNKEFEVVVLTCNGFTNKQISEILSVKEKTVKFHLTNIFKRTRSKNRRSLIHKLYCWRLGLIAS